MREISEATLAILKSQNLTGQNRFSHSLKLEGVDFYSDIKEVKINTVKTGATWADYCIRSDGKVLVAYLSGFGIYLSIIESEQDMLTINNSAGTGTLFYTLSASSDPQCFTLMRLKNGRILFFINESGNYTDNVQHGIKVFESANGLGDDFALKTTLSPYTLTSNNYGYTKRLISKPTQGTDGKIWLTAFSNPIVQYGIDYSRIVVFCSNDNGTTFEIKTSYTPGYNLYYGKFRSMTIIGNTLFCAMQNHQDGNKTHLFISLDDGATWNMNTTSFQNLPIQEGSSPSYSTWRYLLDWHYGLDGFLYMIMRTTNSNTANLYKSKPTGTVTYDYLDNMSNWIMASAGISTSTTADGYLTVSPVGTIHFLHVNDVDIIHDTAMYRDEYSEALNVSSISINKGKGGSNTAAIQASNKDGTLNPKNSDGPLYNILKTNKQIIIKQGYGADLVETFTGMIDDFDMSTWPQTTGIALRDNLKKALDQTVTDGNQHTVEFTSQPIEIIVGYLCYLANIEVGVDAIEQTGISVAMNFSWCSYADAFQQLGDLASFEWGCDSYGKFYFRRDYQPDNMFVAYTFEEGIDLATLKYKISDKDLYSKVVVFGKSGDTVISYEAPFLDAALYNILPQKILKIDATEANTVGALQKIAERSLSMMQSRTAVIQFTSIAIPWLEVGDFIGIYERSTGAASIYRLSDFGFSMDKDSFTMSGTAYYYGDSIVPGELPTDTATQVVAPTVNLIPEMTSNTVPSGVARASSIYTSNYEPWQAFNSHSDDYYWNSITNTGWIEYQFPEKTIVDKYMLKARQLTIYNDAMPRDWKFEGFDGEKWVVLDTQAGQTNWGVYQSRTYLFANTTAYSKYRLNVSRNDGYMRLQLEQLAMYYGGGA